MDCPRCKGELIAEVVKEMKSSVELDVCQNCAGIWFDKGELSQFDKMAEPTFLEIRKLPTRSEQLEPLYCPSCADHPRMEKAEHARDEKVVFDYCTTCKGVWLDYGELEAINKENWLITIGRILKWLFGRN